jgi:hypothetical protein
MVGSPFASYDYAALATLFHGHDIDDRSPDIAGETKHSTRCAAVTLTMALLEKSLPLISRVPMFSSFAKARVV